MIGSVPDVPSGGRVDTQFIECYRFHLPKGTFLKKKKTKNSLSLKIGKKVIGSNLRALGLLFYLLCLGSPLCAEVKLKAYFSNDSINGLKISDAYETHNMGLIYSNADYYVKFDLGIVSPDMHVYRNRYREANRSFGELVSVEVGQLDNFSDDLSFYLRIKATGEFGVDKLQDLAHRLLSLQQVGDVNQLIRMPANQWAGIGARSEIGPNLLGFQNTKIRFDGFVGLDTTFVNTQIIKEVYGPLLTYNTAVGVRFVAYDRVVSAPPVNAKERNFIPEIGFGISYDNGPYQIFIKDSFSLPSIKTDSTLYGMFSAGVVYNF